MISHLCSHEDLPKIASVTILPLSLTADLRDHVGCLVLDHKAKHGLHELPSLGEGRLGPDWLLRGPTFFNFLFNATCPSCRLGLRPRYVKVDGSQHLTILKSGLAFSCFKPKSNLDSGWGGSATAAASTVT